MGHILECHEIVKTDFVRAENCSLYDRQGRRYVDLESGIWCTVLGHNHPRINRRIHAQADKLIHLGTRYPSPIVEAAALDILEITGLGDGKVTFLSSGSEAVEFGVQAVRRITGKPLMLTFASSYLAAYGSSGQKNTAEWHLFDWKACAQCPDQKDCDPDCPRLQVIPFDQIGGFAFEPGGSGSGFVQFPPRALVHRLAERVKQQGGWVVVNEITTGIGRTGKWFGFQHYGLQPDVIAIGKGLGNGYPVSAVALQPEAARLLEESELHYAQSHQNDPLGCSVAREVIATLREEGWIETGRVKGARFLEELQCLAEEHLGVKEARGRGMLLGIELNDAHTGLSVQEVYFALLERGYLVGYYPAGNILRLDPALTIPEEDLAAFIENLGEILKG